MEELNKSGFPDECTSEQEKSKPAYGLQYAKAMFKTAGSVNADRFYGNANYYNKLYRFAQGRQDIADLKQLLGKYAGGEETDTHTYISAQEIKLIPKYINLLQGKLAQHQFDVRLTPLDPLALEPQKQYQAYLQAVLDFRKSGLTHSLSEIASETELFPEIDPKVLAELDEDYLVNLQMNPRYRSAMEGEMAIEKAFISNDWDRVEGEVVKDIVITGIGIGRTYNDKNGNQKIEKIDPRSFLTSYVPTGESFEGMQDAGHVVYLTHSEFRREASPYLDAEVIEDIIKGKVKTTNGHPVTTPSYTHSDDYNTRPTPLGRIAVLRFQFLTENKRSYVLRKNAYGNRKAEKKGFGFKPVKSEEPLYETGEKQLMEPTWTAKYSGSWVIGTDYVYDYGLDTNSQRKLTRIADEKLNYHVFAPNMVDGKTVSWIEQVMEPLSMIAVAWNKSKMILGRGYIGKLKIRFDRLAEIAMSSTDKWTPGKIYKHFLESDILLDAGSQMPGDNISALENISGGLSLADYINMIQTGISLIQDITGINALSDGSTPHERTGVGVAQQALQESNNALDYLRRAKWHLHREVSYSILLLVQKAVRDGFKITVGATLGQNSLSFWEGIDTITEAVALTDMAVEVEDRPSADDWNRLYMSVANAVAAGMLGIEDEIFITRIKNLKQAQEVFTLRTKKYKQEQQQMKQVDVDNNIKQSQAASQAAAESQIAIIQAQMQANLQEIAAKGEQDRLTKQLELNAKGMIQQSMNAAKVAATEKQVQGQMITHAMKSNSAEKIAEKKATEKMGTEA